MTQQPLEQSRTTSQEIGNFLDVSGRTLSSTPKAFWDELSGDLSHNMPRVLEHMTEGAVIGAATTLLLKVPKVAPVAMALGLAYTGVKAITGVCDFAGKASEADTDSQRAAVAQESAHDLGGSLTALTESAPGMILGGYGISKAFGAPPLYTRIGDAANDSYAFRGPGSVKLSSSLINEQGELDGLSASKLLAERHPWLGKETGSSLDLGKLRMSRIVGGKEDIISALPGATRENVVPFHIHGPEAGAGANPSRFDLGATRDLGILQQGQTTTYYVGEGRQYAALARGGNGEYFNPSMRAVTVDAQKGLAQRVTGQWMLGQGWEMDAPVSLDYAETLKALSQIKATSPWLTLSSIAAKTAG